MTLHPPTPQTIGEQLIEIYGAVLGLREDIADIRGEMGELRHELRGQGVRTGRLEGWRAKLAGGVVVVGIVVAVGAQLIGHVSLH